MDLKFKGPNWVGNIYHKFEAICHEVDDIVKKDTIKYVENQMHTVGKNVKKLCADLLPPSGHPVKHVPEDAVITENANFSTSSNKEILQEIPCDTTEKQSPSEPNMINAVINQQSRVSSEHQLGDQRCSLTSMDTLEESESNLRMGNVDDVLTNEESDAENEENAKVILSQSTPPVWEEHSEGSPVGVLVPNSPEKRLVDMSEVPLETSNNKLEFESEQKSRGDNFSDEVEMDSRNQPSPIFSQFQLLEQRSSLTSMDALEGSGSNFFNGHVDGIMANENSAVSNEEFSVKVYAPILLDSTSSGMEEHFMMSPVGVSDQSKDERRHADLSKVGHETSAREMEFESLQIWTFCDNYVDEIECVAAPSNTTSAMSYSVFSENTACDIESASSSSSNAIESPRLLETSPEKLTQEAICHYTVEEVGIVSDFYHVAQTSTHGSEYESLNSTAGNDFADEIVFGDSKSTSEVAFSVVSRENATAEIKPPSSSYNAIEFLRSTENSSQLLSLDALLCHSSGWKDGCVSDSSDGLLSSAPPLTVFSKDKDDDVQLSSFRSFLPVAEGISRTTEILLHTVPSGNQQVKTCGHVQQETVMSSSNTGCSDESSDSSSDIAYSHMESIDLHNIVKIEEQCVDIEDTVLHAVSRRARKQRSYKKKIQEAFTSKKRLVKEYEQLAIWFGDVGLDTSQEAISNKESSESHEAGDFEWELL